VSYRDAVVLLGGDPPALAALDRVLAGALSLGTGGVSGVVLSVFDAQPRIVLLGRDLVHKLRDRLRGASRADRTQRLAAAHAVIVITAYFEALATAELPFALRDLQLDRADEIRLAGGATALPAGPAGSDFLDALLGVAPPQPTPDLPAERFPVVLDEWYRGLSARLLEFARGLAVWEQLDDTQRAAAARTLRTVMCGHAVRRYQELYAQLAVDVPEFRFWAGQTEHQATRAEVRRSLAGVETMLAALVTGAPAAASGAGALAAAYRAVLHRPILAEGETPTGVRLPTLEEGYLDPDFRVSTLGGAELPSDERWWSGIPVRRDLTEYLAGVLTSAEATAAPLLVLGQPGAGKSALTRVLAARLPAAGFLPVRVVLREVAAEAQIQDQIEHAIRATTGLRLEWPSLATATPGATPVVLLDGFDELLQATGVSQSDYLTRVAEFQQREADLGRPTVVLVTTRTSVADRARYPAGTIALRLEPFRPEQIRRWLDMWNAGNAEHLRARGLEPLAPETAARYGALAGEPLLLLMLALYDADGNALQRAADGPALDETRLYEELLRSFAAREVAKSGLAGTDREQAARIEQEMQRLSLTAFSMVNRRRQWVTEAELDSDLAVLLGSGPPAGAGAGGPLSQAGIAIGRFFFVQRAQAISGNARLLTYEFLHATFGEFLAARLAVQLAAGLLGRRPALMVGHTPSDDDLMYALLSFAPLSARQLLPFVIGCCDRAVPEADRAPLTNLLVSVLDDSQRRTGHRHDGYAPAPLPTAARHGIYSANVVLLILTVASLEPPRPVTASQLFPGAADAPGRWHHTALLWRAALAERDWTDLALALRIRHTWAGPARELEISLEDEPYAQPEEVDPYWHHGRPPSDSARGQWTWYQRYWPDLPYKMDMSGGTNDATVRHALEPVFRWLGTSITTFRAMGDGPATSVAHDLISLALLRAASCPDDDLAALYRRLESVFDPPPDWSSETAERAILLTLQFLRADAARLPAVDVTRYLCGTLTLGSHGREILALVPEIATAVLPALRDDEELPGLRALLTAIAAFVRDAVGKLDGSRGGPAEAEPDGDGTRATWPDLAGLYPDNPELLLAVTHPAHRPRGDDAEQPKAGG
jgi:hypothetical protein